jgi:hypothetical protein
MSALPRAPAATPALLALALATACSSGARQGTAWRDDLARVFSNNSVQPSEPPRELWTPADEETLQLRLGHADCAAIGRMKLLSVYASFSSARELSLVFRPQEILHGSLAGALDENGDLQLQLTPSSSDDFRLALQLQKHLPGTRYVMFLKRQPVGTRVVWHWALYRDDPKLISEIRAAYEALRQERERKR